MNEDDARPTLVGADHIAGFKVGAVDVAVDALRQVTALCASHPRLSARPVIASHHGRVLTRVAVETTAR